MNEQPVSDSQWCENIIIANADFIDRVAFDLTVNFERIIGRRIPRADMAQWVECVAMDGGLRPGQHHTQVILVHTRGHRQMENFSPAEYDSLSGQAFSGPLGEFVFTTVCREPQAGGDDVLTDSVALLCREPQVRRLMVVPDDQVEYERVRRALAHAPEELRATLFAMQPMAGGNYRQEILGYSLMKALGISADEIKTY